MAVLLQFNRVTIYDATASGVGRGGEGQGAGMGILDKVYAKLPLYVFAHFTLVRRFVFCISWWGLLAEREIKLGIFRLQFISCAHPESRVDMVEHKIHLSLVATATLARRCTGRVDGYF